jgi:glycosyltransferase involved in cell wall biosynthesis
VSGAAPVGAGAPWLSVLLPVHAVGAWLDDCIASIVDQGVDGVEIVCVDDASPGDDAARLEAWRARRPGQVRVITHATNRGVGAARNTLLDNAAGRYVWFVDPDDLVEAGALAALRAVVDEQAPDIVLCDFRTLAADARRAGAVHVRRAHVRTFDPPPGALAGSRATLVAGLFRSGQMHAWSKIVRRAAWPPGLRFPAGRIFEDLAVLPRLILSTERFAATGQVWIGYRQREGSLLARLSIDKLDDWTSALAGYASELRDAGLGAQADFEVAHFCTRTLLRAVRRLRALPGHARDDAAVARYIERWRTSSPLALRELCRAYLARGWFGRWLQLRWLFLRARAN